MSPVLKHVVPLYHGTGKERASVLVTAELGPDSGSGEGWFGSGLYFWEADENAAWWWAEHWHRSDAAVVAMNLSLDHGAGLDLTTMEGRAKYQEWCEALLADPELREDLAEMTRDEESMYSDAFFLHMLEKERQLCWVRVLVLLTDRDYPPCGGGVKRMDRLPDGHESRVVRNVRCQVKLSPLGLQHLEAPLQLVEVRCVVD